MAVAGARWTSKPYSVAEADRIARALGLSSAVAQILVRRGCATVDDARRFLAAGERHDPWLLGDMEAACELILRHVRRGSRIVVHGDYDVDGVCSTTIAVEALRALGAEPSWHLPSRLEGYGLSTGTVERLASERAGLLITADCGITSVAEVEAAQAKGVDVVVTDHHRPGGRLPPCPVLHPGLGGYPFPGLCAAGVAFKLAAALAERAGGAPLADDQALDLVALATVCDLVPLQGENRSLVRQGLQALARTRRPGLRALMRVAMLDPGDLDERAVGFRLGPRLNAAGRLRRADAALELLMTADEARAAEVADELDLLNRERRDLETRILFAAEAARSEQAHLPVHVIAGEGWHPGVVGIVASRMTERHHRPCVVIALEAGGGRGSGRSIPAFDLHAGLAACAHRLRRFGGHRAAAGFEIAPERVEAFRRDLVKHACEVLSPADLVPVQEVDAVVPATALGLPLAEELRRLSPFGHGNPEPTMVVPATRLANLRPMGEQGQHSRFTLVGSGSRAEAVAFRATPGSLSRDAREPHDAAVRLELNDWNGRVEARVVLTALCSQSTPDGRGRPTGAGGCSVVAGEEPFWVAFERELAAGLEPLEARASAGSPAATRTGAGSGAEPVPGRRAVRDRRGEGIAGVAGELVSSGEPVLVVCADVARRRAALDRLLGGLLGAALTSVSAQDADAIPGSAGGADRPALTSWSTLAEGRVPTERYSQLLALDPPSIPVAIETVAAPAQDGPSFWHLAWGPAEVEFTLAVARAALDLRSALKDVYRSLRASGAAAGPDLEALLRGQGAYPRPPVVCARLVRVLLELELVAYERRDGAEPSCRPLERPRTALERSPAYRAYSRRLAEAERYLAGEAARFGAPGAAPSVPAATLPGESPGRGRGGERVVAGA